MRLSRYLAALALSICSQRRALVLVALLIGLVTILGGHRVWGWYQFRRHLRAAEQAAGRRDFAEAQAQLLWCLAQQPEAGSIAFQAARAARRAGDPVECERLLQNCARLSVDSEAIRLERLLLHAQEGDLSNNLDGYLWSRVQQGDADAALILEALIQGYQQTFQPRQMLQCTDLLLEREPANAQALVWRAWIWKRARQVEKAEADYRAALALDADYSQARLRLAELLLTERGQPAEALDHFARLYERWPENAEVLLGYARCRYALGQTSEAAELVNRLLAADGKNYGALTLQGELALGAEQPAEAEKVLREAVRLRPDNRAANYALAQCLQQLGRQAEAQVYLGRVEEIASQLERLEQLVKQTAERPHDAGLRCETGKLLLRTGQVQQGLHWLALALEEDPGHQPTHQALAEYYQGIGDPARATYHRARAR